MSEFIGLPISTIQSWASTQKQDATQETHKMVRQLVKRSIDINVLIHHFSGYRPKDNIEREEIKRLIITLMDCAKR